MSRKRLLLSLSTILILLGGAYLAYGYFKPTREYGDVTSNLQNAYLMDDALYFYNGSFFARYNTAKNTVDRLGDYMFIKNGISNLSWSPDAVVFQSNPQTQDRDDITTAAASLGEKQYNPHWWKYNFNDKQYQLLNFSDIDDCESLVQVNAVELACSKEQSPGSITNDLATYNISSKSSKKILSSDETLSSLSASKDVIYYLETRLSGAQTLKSVSLKSSKSNSLYQGEGQLSYVVGANGSVLINDGGDESIAKIADESDSHADEASAKSSSQKIVLIEGGGVVLEKDIKSMPVLVFSNSSGQMMYSSLDGSVNEVTSDGIETLDKAPKNPLETGDRLYKINERLFVVSTNDDLLTSPHDLVGVSRRDPQSFDSVKDNDNNSDWWIDSTDMDNPGGYLYSESTPTSAQQLEIDKWLLQRRFWPSEFSFTWVADGAGFNAPISPRFVIIQ